MSDADRAVALAALAAEAQAESVLDGLAAPVVTDRPGLQHLEQQPGAAARRVALLAGHEVARAHHLLAAVVAPALADADAALHGPVEAALVREREPGLGLRRPVTGPDAQVRGDRIRIDHLAGVHPGEAGDDLEQETT